MKLSLTFLAPSPLKFVMRQVSLPSIQRQRPSLKGQHESEPTDDLAEYAVSYSLITLFASVMAIQTSTFFFCHDPENTHEINLLLLVICILLQEHQR